jgi:hypothetical protein
MSVTRIERTRSVGKRLMPQLGCRFSGAAHGGGRDVRPLAGVFDHMVSRSVPFYGESSWTMTANTPASRRA